MRAHKKYTLHMSLNARSSALVTSRTVMDPTAKEEHLRESAKGPACLTNSRTERRKALRAERARQDQARCSEQRRTRGFTILRRMRTYGRSRVASKTADERQARLQRLCMKQLERLYSCRAYIQMTDRPSCSGYVRACVRRLKRMALPQARPTMLCIH